MRYDDRRSSAAARCRPSGDILAVDWLRMIQIGEFYKSVLNTMRRIWRHSHRVLLIGGTCVVVACQTPPESVPLVVTEVYDFEGEEIVITRVVTPTPSPVPTTAVPAATPIPAPVELDLSVFGAYGVLDPQRAAYGASDAVTIDMLENLYAGLVTYNHTTNTLEPELALTWEMSPDGRTWTFQLRDDVYWVRALRPGVNLLTGVDESARLVEVERLAPVSAEDVVLALRRACDPRTGTPYIFILFVVQGCEQLNTAPVVTDELLNQLGIRAVSATTLQITTREPAAYLPAMTTLPVFRPIPGFLINDSEANWLDPVQFVTSGPFVLSPLSTSDEVTILQRNPHWNIPFRGNVELVNLYEYEARLDAYDVWQENLLDITLLPFQLTGDFLSNPATRPPVVTDGEVFYLGFNFDSPVFRIPEVRRAFSAAIDRERLLDEVYGNRGKAMRHFTPPSVLHAPPVDQVGMGYSPSRALLELEGGGFISCRLIGEIRYMISSSDLALQHAEALIRMWVENLGCDENQFIIEQVQFGTLLAKTRRTAGPERPDIWDLGWASFFPDAHDWFDQVLHCEHSDNRPNRPCSELDILIEDAAVTANVEERQQIYRQVENILFDEVGLYPIAPLYVRGDYLLAHPWVTYTPSQFGGEQFDTFFVNQEVKELERSQ